MANQHPDGEYSTWELLGAIGALSVQNKGLLVAVERLNGQKSRLQEEIKVLRSFARRVDVRAADAELARRDNGATG